ncbi:TOBE domain-containing protein, partial [Corynebacterium sp.]|uniref:TOBE domain-containing protein n=1 Tax=Corynebacterium sp. TaxID=1720 RepID=UPI0026DFF72D
LGATAVYVTHDQSEAMAMSDLVVVMNAGRIEQVASPTELYRRPASRFVAGFVGRANLIDVEVASVDVDGARIRAFGQELTVPAHPDLGDRDFPAVLLVRPEQLELTPLETGAADDSTATVIVSAFMGERIDYELDWQGQRLLASLANPEESDVYPEGTRVRLSTAGSRAWVLPADEERA